jgi:hypothetical protein
MTSMDCSRFRDDMLDVLYGEADPVVSARFEAHRAGCSDCRDEVSGFQRVRRNLQTWRVDAQLRPARRVLPGLRGLAAAAAVVLAFGGGLALARTEVSYREGELRVAFGGGHVRGAEPATAELAQRVAQLEAAHRADMEALKVSLAQPLPSTGNANQDVLLRRVQQMVQESEGRQRMVLQARLIELAQQRQVDMLQISTNFSQLEARTASDIARMSNVIRINEP